ncbi:MAG: single-stranded DNA-binding protein [Ignavibacteriae bacterium]|nr:MAG: single-stranded DNA-binding protein [Ignavibacteriota bacterium]RPI66565.1 MAG: single-stranded DNA-binding protein [Ignavibacteriota bacterium]
MSRTLNKVMLIGNVGKDPDVHFTPSGVKVAQFRMATTETWKDKEGAVQEHTDWHTIIAWRGLADVVEKLIHRGSRVYIEGKIQSRSYDDKEGIKRYVVEVVAENLLNLDSKKPESVVATSEDESTGVDPDVIPF